MNAYTEMKSRHRVAKSTLPWKFAFGQQQFDEMLSEWGLLPTDTDKICTMCNAGDYMLKTDAKTVAAMFAEHESELAAAIASDETGEGFIFDMFSYELANHEFTVTCDETDALRACGLDWDDIEKDKRLRHGLKKARQVLIDQYKKERAGGY